MIDVDQSVLLSMLPESAVGRLGNALSIVSAAAGDVLLDADESIADVFFPLDMVVSFDQVLEHEDDADPSAPGVALVGREGLIGVELFLGADQSVNRATVRLGGRLVRIAADAAREEFTRCGVFQRLVLRITEHLFIQTCAIAACERVHTVEKRLIRWLLMFHDRAPSGDLALTQDALSQLLQVRRVSVTASARLLQLEGLISYRRGIIMITDPDGLAARACACYHAIKASHRGLFDPS